MLPAETFEIWRRYLTLSVINSRPNAEQIPPVSLQSIKHSFVGSYGLVFLYNYTYGDLFFILSIEINVHMQTKFCGSYLHDIQGWASLLGLIHTDRRT